MGNVGMLWGAAFADAFVRGTCSGIDGYDALSAAPGSNALLSVLLLAVLATIGVYLVVIAWLPRLTRATWLWSGCGTYV